MKKNQVYIAAIATLLFSLPCGLQAQTPHPPARLPNILFCIADDASYPFMSAYGCQWVHTPGFDEVARNGILFNNAYTPNAKCAPSRSCILTGRNSWQLEAAANHVAYLPAKFITYAEALDSGRYFVGYTGKGWAPGDAGTVNGKKREPAGKPYNRIRTVPPTRQISPIDYAANFRAFMKEKPRGQPFCFWFGGFEPHRPYAFRSGIEKGGKSVTAIDKVPPFWPDNDTIRADMLDYAFELEYFDKQLVKALQILKESGELDNTIIVVTADNGMPFPRAKGQEYEYSNHIPLAVMWKNGIQHPGRIVDDFVSFIDLAPTFLEVAGVDPGRTGMQPITGKSLTDIFYSSREGTVNPQRDHVLIGKERHDVGRPHDEGYPIRGIIAKGFLYLHNFKTDRWPAGNPETGYLNVDGSPTKTQVIQSRKTPDTRKYWEWSLGKRQPDELYRLQSDRSCLNDLSANPEYRHILDTLRTQLFTELKAQQDPRMYGRGDIFDQYPYANPDVRNFYEKYSRGEKVRAGWVNPTDFDTLPEFLPARMKNRASGQ
ncbi:sulfatase [Compostibacter hankyongensis]|uniref:Sulfatase n=1 Tax=Compostibacter hankyongensis TaxID=1007089 RepID=A0ABP8FK38_9BACT